MRHSILAFTLALTGVAPAIAQDPQTESVLHDHEAEIRDVVADYFWGRQNGDQVRLERAFELENGHFKFVRRDETDSLVSMTLGDFAARMDASIPTPNEGRIMMMDIVDEQMAFVKLELAGTNRTFIDYFILYRIDGAWRIVNKTAAVFPANPPG